MVADDDHNEHDIDSAEMNILHRADETETMVNNNGSDEAPLTIAESSEQTLFLSTASPSSLPDVVERDLTVVDTSEFTAVEIFDKRSSPVWCRLRVRA